jgi:hypothetical protein
MKNCNSGGGFTGPVTLGACVQAVAEVDNTPNEYDKQYAYFTNLVKDELEDLLEIHDKLFRKHGGGSGGWAIKKLKELLEEKIEIINGSM